MAEASREGEPQRSRTRESPLVHAPCRRLMWHPN